jgi:transcriptional regulator with XRE-family HTH domain
MGESESIHIVAVVVQTLCKEQGSSREAVAARCHMHRAYVGAIERAEENPTHRPMDKLANALRVNPVQLLVPTSPPSVQPLPKRSPTSTKSVVRTPTKSASNSKKRNR